LLAFLARRLFYAVVALVAVALIIYLMFDVPDRLERVFFHFDFGMNLRRQHVTDLVADKFPYTLKLALIAFAIEVVGV